MQNTSRKQFVIYSRKSKFTGKGESIENQIELCRQYIRTHYSQEEAEAALLYEDEGYSGRNLDRPQFRKMMKDSVKNEFYAIVVYRLDRISRNIGDFAKLIEDLGERRIAFISIREQFDTSSPMGRAMMYIASVFSQLERETIAERIRDNMRELAKTGRWLGGVAPTGYESESVSRVSIDGKERKSCKLRIIPEEIGTVKTIYAKFMETGSLTQVERYLLEKQIVTKRGNRFSRFAVKAILSNPVYMIADDAAYHYLTGHHIELFAERSDFDGVHGIMAYNRTQQEPGKTHRINSMEEWIVSVGGHEGLIPGETWIGAQEMLELNKSKSYRRPHSSTALLSGILYCSDCGDYMRPKHSGRVNADGKPMYRYLCCTKERSRRKFCTMKNPNGSLLDSIILGEIKKYGRDKTECLRQIQNIKMLPEADGSAGDDEMTFTRKVIGEREEAVRGLVAALARSEGTNAEQYIFDEIGRAHEKIEELKNRLSFLEQDRRGTFLSEAEFKRICQLLSSFDTVMDDMNPEQQRTIIRSFVRRIVWDGENVHLYFRDERADEPSGEDSK
ncbi:MAG: recombinase family protein [Clostridia bacterium]|nr:recombinase family protein [Clostridia bacterium]